MVDRFDREQASRRSGFDNGRHYHFIYDSKLKMDGVALRSIEVFCAAVEAGSFTAAAHQLGLTPAAVSRSIAQHELSLGVRLFRRTTRRVSLTDEGQAYFEPCRQALSLIEEAERKLTQRQTKPRGRVRISVPTTYGHYRALPVIARFGEAHPAVEVEVNVSNRNVDFVTEGYDLVIRAGELGDSSLLARKLEDASLGVFASPGYLAAHGTPKTPDDLSSHRMIGFVRPSTGRVLDVLFKQKGVPFELAVKPAVRCSDDFLGCVTLARAGAGITQAFHFLAADAIARGELREVLEPYAGRSRPFTLLQPSGRAPTLAARLLGDALIEAAGVSRPPRAAARSRGR
jgi:DNA-binding transcriptional LysR family regulator